MTCIKNQLEKLIKKLKKQEYLMKISILVLAFFLILFIILILIYTILFNLEKLSIEYYEISINTFSALAALLSVLIALFIPFIMKQIEKKKEEEKEKKEEEENLPILRNRIIFIMKHIYDRREILIHEIDSKSGTSNKIKRDQEKNRRKNLKNDIRSYISRLGDFGLKLLNKVECEIYGLKYGSFRLFKNYLIGPMGIEEDKSSGQSKNITHDKEKINEILQKLNNLF